MSLYDDLFSQFNQPIAQILLTKNDLADVSYDPSIGFFVSSDSAPRYCYLAPSCLSEETFLVVVVILQCVLTLICWHYSSSFREHNI